MSKKQKQKSDADQPYVNEAGEILVTEAELRAKVEAELREELSKEQVLDEKVKKESVVGRKDAMLEFTVSGCYYDSRKETVDFEDLKILVPTLDEDVGSMHLRGRYIVKAIKQAVDKNGDLRYPKRVEKVRQVFIDDIQPAKGTLSFVGKGIKQLDIGELQDLATCKDLRFIPTPTAGLSKRDLLIRAYVAYADKVLNKTIKYQEEKFNFAKLPDIVLDSQIRYEDSEKITNEEMIDQERNAPPTSYGEKDDPKKRFTLEELKAIARNKNINYNESVEFTDLYNLLFSS